MKTGKLYKIIEHTTLIKNVGVVFAIDNTSIMLPQQSIFMLLKHRLLEEEECDNLDYYKEIIILHNTKIYKRNVGYAHFEKWFEEL